MVREAQEVVLGPGGEHVAEGPRPRAEDEVLLEAEELEAQRAPEVRVPAHAREVPAHLAKNLLKV